MLFQFGSSADLQRWNVFSDSQYGGHSAAALKPSTGHKARRRPATIIQLQEAAALWDSADHLRALVYTQNPAGGMQNDPPTSHQCIGCIGCGAGYQSRSAHPIDKLTSLCRAGSRRALLTLRAPSQQTWARTQRRRSGAFSAAALPA